MPLNYIFFFFRFQTDSLRVLKHMLKNQENDMYKEAQLTFDEMAVTSTIEMDRKTQKIIGPHDKAMVVMVRGLGPK